MQSTGTITGTKHLVYRCFKCGRVLTCIDINKAWDASDGHLAHMPLCVCGSRHVSPTNAKLWEELLLPRIWKLWWVKIVTPWLKAKFAK